MKGSLLKPCMPVDGKQPTWDAAEQNKAEKIVNHWYVLS